MIAWNLVNSVPETTFQKGTSQIWLPKLSPPLSMNGQEKRGKGGGEGRCLTWSMVKDTPHLTNHFSVLKACMVGSTKNMLDTNAPPVTGEVVSKAETPELADMWSEREKWILEDLQLKIFWRSTYIPIQVHTVYSNHPLAMKALIDCSTTGEFIDHEFVWAHKLQMFRLLHPIGLYNADRSPNKIRKITKAIDLIVQYKGHKSWSKFYILSISHKAIVLGHTWLAEHNLNINWHTGKVKLTHCPDDCRQAESTSNCLDDEASVKTTTDSLERIHATSTMSTQLVEAAKGDMPHATLEEMILETYHCFQDMFLKESFGELPEWKQWDHAIKLTLGSQPFSMKVYPISPIKQKELDNFLEENLLSGCICPSKSPMASPVFFIKKKDGKLQFVQDYLKLNAITVKNTYPLPLVLDIINQISDSKARYFTKLDVHWGYNNVWIKEGDEWKSAFQMNWGPL